LLASKRKLNMIANVARLTARVGNLFDRLPVDHHSERWIAIGSGSALEIGSSVGLPAAAESVVGWIPARRQVFCC
jgi:hypothetical protein